MAIKKVFIGVGHGGKDSGAVNKTHKEKDINLIMAMACKDVLVAHGVEVMLSRAKDEDDTVEDEVRECNQYNPDVAIDIHNNAGGGVGFEVYHSINGGTGKTLAENIWGEVNALGQIAHGAPVKTKKNSNGTDYYWFIRGTKCPSVITEGAFLDNPKDFEKIDEEHEMKAYGEAYAIGILKTLDIMPKIGTPVESKEKIGYRVQVGAFVKKENADLMVKKLKADGYDAFVVKV